MQSPKTKMSRKLVLGLPLFRPVVALRGLLVLLLVSGLSVMGGMLVGFWSSDLEATLLEGLFVALLPLDYTTVVSEKLAVSPLPVGLVAVFKKM